MLILTPVLYLLTATVSAETEEKRDGKSLSVFNVVREVVIKKIKKTTLKGTRNSFLTEKTLNLIF